MSKHTVESIKKRPLIALIAVIIRQEADEKFYHSIEVPKLLLQPPLFCVEVAR